VKGIASEVARAREWVRGRRDTRAGITSVAPGGADDPGLDMESLSSQIDLLTWHFADQERRLASLDEPAAPAVDCAALEAELEAVRARVRTRRGGIAARAAAQSRSAHHIEAKAQRLEERLDRLCHDRERLRELELAIAGAEAALIGSQVELEEAAAQLAASEREVSSCANDCALLRERGATAGVARDIAAQRLHRIRSKLAALEDDADGLRAQDVMSRSEGASGDAAVREFLSQLRVAVEECAVGVEGMQGPEDVARSVAPAGAAKALPWLDRGALRLPVERRLRVLEALAEIRVEVTQAAHAAGADDRMRSHAAFARVSSTHIRLLLDEHERVWILDALEAVGHEQGARLSHCVDREPDALAGQLHDAVTAWRRCDERLEEADARTRTAQHELASLRGTVAPAVARVDAEVRDQGVRIRERRDTLRARTRSGERAASRLRVARQRQRALAKSVRRARNALDRLLASIGSPAIADVLGRLGALERDVEAATALIAGLRAAHEHVVHAMKATEQELLELSRAQPAVPAVGPAAVNAQDTSPSEEPWTRARTELDIAALADELERWKTRHAQLEQRVDAQAGLLASVESVQRQDEALAEFRLELEHARSVAHASLERALGLSGGAPHLPAPPDTAGGDADPPSPSVPTRTAR